MERRTPAAFPRGPSPPSSGSSHAAGLHGPVGGQPRRRRPPRHHPPSSLWFGGILGSLVSRRGGGRTRRPSLSSWVENPALCVGPWPSPLSSCLTTAAACMSTPVRTIDVLACVDLRNQARGRATPCVVKDCKSALLYHGDEVRWISAQVLVLPIDSSNHSL